MTLDKELCHASMGGGPGYKERSRLDSHVCERLAVVRPKDDHPREHWPDV